MGQDVNRYLNVSMNLTESKVLATLMSFLTLSYKERERHKNSVVLFLYQEGLHELVDILTLSSMKFILKYIRNLVPATQKTAPFYG